MASASMCDLKKKKDKKKISLLIKYYGPQQISQLHSVFL